MPHPDSPFGQAVHWQTEQWRLQQKERDELKRHIEELENSLDKQSDAFRSKIPNSLLQKYYDIQVGAIKGTYDFSKSIVGVSVDASVFLDKLTNPLGWFDPGLQGNLRQAYSFGLRMQRANLTLQFGSLQEKKRLLTKAADIAQQVYQQAHKSLQQQWTEAKRTGKEAELISRWTTRITLEIGTLVVGVGEAKGAVAGARAAEAAEFSEATKAAATGAKAGTTAAKEVWVGEAAAKEIEAGSVSAKAGSAKWELPQEAVDKVPAEWGEGVPNRKGEGLRWQDPSDQGNGIRIDRGNPDSPFPSQQVDHVVVRSDGNIIGPDGNSIAGPLKENPEAHIPLSQWLQWATWNSP